jgi:hypothetical protein
MCSWPTQSGFYTENSGFTTSWNNISDNLMSNNVYSSISNLYDGLRLFIVGEDFTYGGVDFKQRNVYKYDETLSTWVIDVSFQTPLISKLNFRYGVFNGKHNDGIFGSNLKSADWNGSTWNSGIFLNSNW